jgi:transcriptional regulator with XRE-family HTH domain
LNLPPVDDQKAIMKLSDLKTSDELLEEQLASDPAFRAEWERTALARGIAVALVRYRAAHDLAQRDLAARLEMTQPQVARLERGDTNPSMDTLMRLAAGLSIEFTIDVRPVHSKARLITKQAENARAVGSISTDRAKLVVAAT